MATRSSSGNDSAEARERGTGVCVGIIVAPGAPAARVDELAAAVRERMLELRQQEPVHLEIVESPALGRPALTMDLVDIVRRELLARGWELAIGVTDVPLRLGRRAVAGHASPTHGVALLSLPALGVGRTTARAHDALTRLIDHALGEGCDGDLADGRRSRRLRGRIARLRAIGDERGGAGTVLTGGYLRLLVGLVWNNEPWRFAARLSRALVGALAAAAFALVTTDLWRLGDHLGGTRLSVLTALSIIATTVALVLVHGLWERNARPETRTQVALFNLATTATVLLGVTTLYVALLVATAATGLLLLPASLFGDALGHETRLADYLGLAWLISSLATIGGGIAGGLESDATVREATYASDAEDDAQQ